MNDETNNLPVAATTQRSSHDCTVEEMFDWLDGKLTVVPKEVVVWDNCEIIVPEAADLAFTEPDADAPAQDEPSAQDEPTALTAAVDHVLQNVDGVCDAFARLEQKFSGIERLCECLARM
jgi:hypothetical protein